jgi:hypothetical protein
MRIGALTIGASANIEKPTTHSLRANKGFRLGINVAVEAKIQVPNDNATNWSDVNTTVLVLDSYSTTPSEPYYTTLRVGRTTSGRIYLDGAYECEMFEIIENGTGSRYALNVEPGTSIRCRTFNYVVYDTGKGFTNQVVVKLYGEATAKETRQNDATRDASDDFVLDVTDATSATLTLGGQTIYGDAPTCAVALTGTARIDERGLTSHSLTLNADASFSINGGSAKAATLTLDVGTIITFSGIDTTFTVTETATVGAATFIGIGYFATPPGTDTSSASFAETVRNCDYGANVSSFSASPDTVTTALLSWVKQDLTPSVLIEEANGSVWNVVNNRATGDSLFVDISAPKTFRLFDGEKFFTASVRPYGTAYELAEEQTIGYLKTLISTGYLN